MQTHIHDRLDDYLTGSMSSSAIKAFEHHIASCRSCDAALRDAQEAQGFISWLHPVEAAPEPSPNFYRNIERSIEKKAASGWLANLGAMLQGPRLAYPLLFLLAGLLLTAWTMNIDADWTEAGILGIPPARFSEVISSDADRAQSREMVLVSLVEELE